MSTPNVKSSKKKQQVKYQKPTQAIYRPPSARVESNQSDSMEFVSDNYPNDMLASSSRLQQNFQTTFGNVNTNVFPIKGVLKRSKSFGNNNRNNADLNSPSLNQTENGRFLLSMEGLSWENITLIKQALDLNTCASLSMTQLLQIIRILCNKVLEKPVNAKVIAQVCLEINYKQQMSMTNLSDHRYLFLESLANCLREWFNERDKLRFTTGGARRWTAYIMFIMEIYLNLKENIVNVPKGRELDIKTNDSTDGSDGESSNQENNSDDEEVSRAFTDSASNESSTEMSSSSKNDYSERNLKKSPSGNIEAKIINSLLTKQQKHFSNLLLDSFQVILSNPNSTPAEIECMQTVFRKCGKYLHDDNPGRIKAIIFIIRDVLLNCSNVNQFINANNSSNNSSITKNLLEIIELAASDWIFDQPQQIYYFPYTKME